MAFWFGALAVATCHRDADGACRSAKTKFVFANASPYDKLDPHMILDVGRVASRINIYDGLLRWLDNPAKLDPWLAESYTISPGRQDLHVQAPQGRQVPRRTEIKAADVVYSMERILALAGQSARCSWTLVQAGHHQGARRAHCRVQAGKPSAIFLAIVPEVHVVNTALLKKNEKDGDWGKVWLSKDEAGSGSYKLRRYDPAIGFIGRAIRGAFTSRDGARSRSTRSNSALSSS